MKKLGKRILYGCLIVTLSMIMGIITTIFFDLLVKFYGHEQRFFVIFMIGGCLNALAIIAYAVLLWTNNFGKRTKTSNQYLDEEDYIKESEHLY